MNACIIYRALLLALIAVDNAGMPARVHSRARIGRAQSLYRTSCTFEYFIKFLLCLAVFFTGDGAQRKLKNIG